MKTERTKPLQVGIIGCGEVTRYKHLVALRHAPSIEVKALADLDSARVNQVADQFGIAGRYTDPLKMLANPTLEAVGVCVQAERHVEQALSVLDAGKHVLIEKPLALSLADCDRLMERAGQTPSVAMVGFHMRFHRLVRQAREIVQSGTLGTIESIRTVWNSPLVYDESLPAWRNARETGGGALVEIAVHHFDLWRFLLGSEVEEVFSVSRCGEHVDETALVTARMTDGVLAGGFFSERTSHDIEIEICGRDGRLRVSCLRFDGLELHPLSSRPGSVGQRLAAVAHTLREMPLGLKNMRQGGDYILSYRSEWEHFAQAIRTGAPIEATLDDGRRALQVVLAVAESASTGQPVEIARAAGEITPVRALAPTR